DQVLVTKQFRLTGRGTFGQVPPSALGQLLGTPLQPLQVGIVVQLGQLVPHHRATGSVLSQHLPLEPKPLGQERVAVDQAGEGPGESVIGLAEERHVFPSTYKDCTSPTKKGDHAAWPAASSRRGSKCNFIPNQHLEFSFVCGARLAFASAGSGAWGSPVGAHE